MRETIWSVALASALLLVCGCGDAEVEQKSSGEASGPPALGGKGDVAELVDVRGPLGLGEGEAQRAEFTEDLQFFAWELELAAGAALDVEVSQLGSSRGLDTTLWVFGPRTESGGYGYEPVAFDDDAGWGTLSRVRGLELPQGGDYLVVVGTYDGYGRGRMRVLAECANGACAPDARAGECVFGDTYYGLLDAPEAIVVTGSRVVDSPDDVGDLTGRQILEAVRQTAYDDVTTLAQALEAVDQGRANVHDLWDASARRAFVSVEVGAGDNSFGAIFPAGSDAPVATIVDGDITGCETSWGPERRACASSDDCAQGLSCQGVVEGQGACMDPRAEMPAGVEAPCADDLGCGVGLVCAGAGAFGSGMCGPAELRRAFGSGDLDVAIPDDGEVSVTLDTFGLASVHTDVVIDLHVSHPRAEDLQIVLTNSSGTESVVADGLPGREIYLTGVALAGFPGDEDANGRWTLTLRDTAPGESGTLYGFSLEITSRWD